MVKEVVFHSHQAGAGIILTLSQGDKKRYVP
jgi:hypothetical protein